MRRPVTFAVTPVGDLSSQICLVGHGMHADVPLSFFSLMISIVSCRFFPMHITDKKRFKQRYKKRFSLEKRRLKAAPSRPLCSVYLPHSCWVQVLGVTKALLVVTPAAGIVLDELDAWPV